MTVEQPGNKDVVDSWSCEAWRMFKEKYVGNKTLPVSLCGNTAKSVVLQHCGVCVFSFTG